MPSDVIIQRVAGTWGYNYTTDVYVYYKIRFDYMALGKLPTYHSIVYEKHLTILFYTGVASQSAAYDSLSRQLNDAIFHNNKFQKYINSYAITNNMTDLSTASCNLGEYYHLICSCCCKNQFPCYFFSICLDFETNSNASLFAHPDCETISCPSTFLQTYICTNARFSWYVWVAIVEFIWNFCSLTRRFLRCFIMLGVTAYFNVRQDFHGISSQTWGSYWGSHYNDVAMGEISVQFLTGECTE